MSDRTYGQAAFGDGNYGGALPAWDTLQGPVGPTGEPDLALTRPVSALVIPNTNWKIKYEGFGDGTVYRDRQGVCHLTTVMQLTVGTLAAGAIMGYLPVGFWPLNRVMHLCYNGNPETGSRLDINTDGGLQMNSTVPAGQTFCVIDAVWYSVLPSVFVLNGLEPTGITNLGTGQYLVTTKDGRVGVPDVVPAPDVIAAASSSVPASATIGQWNVLYYDYATNTFGSIIGFATEAAAAIDYYSKCNSTYSTRAIIGTFQTSAPVGMARTQPDSGGWSVGSLKIGLSAGFDLMPTTTVLRDTGTPAWTASPGRAAPAAAGFFSAASNLANGTAIPLAPGWTAVRMDTFNSGAPQAWVATDATNTAWRTTVAYGPTAVYFIAQSSGNMPTGSVVAFFVNGLEVARTNITKPTNVIGVRTDNLMLAINDVLSVQVYNPTAGTLNLLATTQAGPGTKRPALDVRTSAGAYQVNGDGSEAAGDQWVCPATGRYDIHLETCGGSGIVAYQLLINRRPVASCTPGYNQSVQDFTLNTLDVSDVALTVGDLVGVGVVMYNYSSPGAYVSRVDSAVEGTAMPYLRISARSGTAAATINDRRWLAYV